MLTHALAWLGDTSWSMGIRESIWVYPIIETSHVMALGVFVGLAVLLDFRLVGLALPRIPASHVFHRLGPWIWSGFGVMVATGSLLFAADPVKFSNNPYFQLKLLLLVIGGVNAATFHVTVYRRVLEWEGQPSAPRAGMVAGWISLAVWVGVVAAGRLIAFYVPPELS